jgi:hypothetical protein
MASSRVNFTFLTLPVKSLATVTEGTTGIKKTINAGKWQLWKVLRCKLYMNHNKWTIHHSVVCLMTRPQPLLKWVLHRVQSSAASFNFQYPLFSIRSSSSFLHLLPHLQVTSIIFSIFISVTHFRRQFLCNMWPIQLDFLLLIDCRI